MTTDEIKAANEASRARYARSRERVQAAEKKAKRLTRDKTRDLWKRIALDDHRISFRIAFFTDEADADLLAARHVIDRVKFPAIATYNGGYMHGAPCGREPDRDFTRQDGTRLYACTY